MDEEENKKVQMRTEEKEDEVTWKFNLKGVECDKKDY